MNGLDKALKDVESLCGQNDFSQAEKLLLDAYRDYYNYTQIHETIVYFYCNCNQYDKVIYYFIKAQNQFLISSKNYLAIASYLMSHKQIALAEEVLLAGKEKHRQDQDIYNELIKIYQHTSQFKKLSDIFIEFHEVIFNTEIYSLSQTFSELPENSCVAFLGHLGYIPLLMLLLTHNRKDISIKYIIDFSKHDLTDTPPLININKLTEYSESIDAIIVCGQNIAHSINMAKPLFTTRYFERYRIKPFIAPVIDEFKAVMKFDDKSFDGFINKKYYKNVFSYCNDSQILDFAGFRKLWDHYNENRYVIENINFVVSESEGCFLKPDDFSELYCRLSGISESIQELMIRYLEHWLKGQGVKLILWDFIENNLQTDLTEYEKNLLAANYIEQKDDDPYYPQRSRANADRINQSVSLLESHSDNPSYDSRVLSSVIQLQRNSIETANSRIVNIFDEDSSGEFIFKRVAEETYSPLTDNIREYAGEVGPFPKAILCNKGLCPEPKKSKYVNIVNGERIVPDSVESAQNSVFFIGGCVTYGIFAEDGLTIPGYFQKMLNLRMSDKEKYRVRNLGMYGRLFLQNVLQMVRQEYKAGDIVFLRYRGYGDPFLINLKPEFRKNPCDEVFADIAHPNHKGYEIIADQLYKYAFRETGISAGMAGEDYAISSNEEEVIDFLVANYEQFAQQRFENSITEGVKQYLSTLPEMHNTGKTGVIVMNCNPFTLGHRYLIEYASAQVDTLIILVLEEDLSYFKFVDRIELVKQGVSDLEKVHVFPSGNFVISSVTLPEYFNKDKDQNVVIDATMDINIFARYICPHFNITVRFVGQEPFDRITRQYNEQLMQQLGEYGIELKEITRIEDEVTAISASRVRKCIESGDLESIKTLVPPTTFEFIKMNFF